MSVLLKKEIRKESNDERGMMNDESETRFNSSFLIPHSSFPFVRAYQSGDYAAALRLWEEANLRPFTAVEIDRLLGAGGGALVAVQQEQVVGVVLWSHNGSIGILWRLAVAESARGQGIATRLLDRAEQDILALGLSGVSLLTRVSNTVAKGMYTRRGYRWNDHLEFWGKKLFAETGSGGEAALNGATGTAKEQPAAHAAEAGQAAGKDSLAGAEPNACDGHEARTISGAEGKASC